MQLITSLDMAMKTVILDSSPSVNLHEPSNISLNVCPPYINLSKKRGGQPLLGQRQVNYTHFVSMGEGSEHMKELLSLEETDNTESKAVAGRDELMKAEKVMKGEEKGALPDPVFDFTFEREAKEFVNHTQKHDEEDTFKVDNDDESATDTNAKNFAEIATLIASTQPRKSPARKPSKAKKKKPAKKNQKKIKKIKKFHIMKKKK